MNTVTVYVKYRLKDFKDFYLASRHIRIFGKINLIVILFLIHIQSSGTAAVFLDIFFSFQIDNNSKEMFCFRETSG